MSIQFQKDIADELLRCLEVVCPHIILAGGAPRDWSFGKEANDLDFYISLPDGLSQGQHKSMIEAVLPAGVTEIKSEYQVQQGHMYQHMKALCRIYYFLYEGIEFQLIQLHSVSDVYNAVGNMSCSICKIWYKNGRTTDTQDFRLTLKSGYMFLNEGYSWADYHPAKMLERFSSTESNSLHFLPRTREKAMSKFLEEAI